MHASKNQESTKIGNYMGSRGLLTIFGIDFPDTSDISIDKYKIFI